MKKEKHYLLDCIIDDEKMSLPIIDKFEYNGSTYYIAYNEEKDESYLFTIANKKLVIINDEKLLQEVTNYYNNNLVESDVTVNMTF